MKFESTKSISRWRPPNGTARLDRSRVSGWVRSPLPAARGLGAVDAAPRPLEVAVQPHAVVAALARAPLRQRERRPRRDGLERLAEGRVRDTAPLHLARDVLEPERPLEPPVAEELGVVRRADHAAAARPPRRAGAGGEAADGAPPGRHPPQRPPRVAVH